MKKKKVQFELPKSNLAKKLFDNDLLIHTNISLKKIIYLDESEINDIVLTKFLQNINIDILISDAETKFPIYAIIFIDPIDFLTPTKSNDNTQINYIFKNINIGLLKVGTEILTEYEKTSILDWIIERSIKRKQKNEEDEELIDPFSDEIIFSAKNYFPPINKVTNRLAKKSIDSSHISGGKYVKSAKYQIKLSKSEIPNEHYGQYVFISKINVVDNKLKTIASSNSKVIVSLFEIASVKNIANIPVIENLYFQTDGITLSEIGKSLSIYIALKKIEANI